MKPTQLGLRICLVALLTGGILLAQSPIIRGFLTNDAQKEQEFETTARAIPNPSLMAKYMAFMAAEPHEAGSPRSKAVAEYIEKMFSDWGLNPQVEQFSVLLPYPTMRKLQVLGPKPYEAKLKEPAVPQDPNSADRNQLPTYNAYSAAGDVTGEVVYANFGTPDDYEWLAKKGIRVKGKIVLTRYGATWRGIKPKLAAEHGAIACIIYSDPHEDGFFPADIFPVGPMRPWQGVQRGSVMDMPYYPGDPLTPGWASVEGARRLPRDEAKTIMKIPVLPISYGDAEPILDQLTGPVAPFAWRGSLPQTYHVGPGAAKVRLKLDFDWTNKPIYDVIATIPGSVYPDEWVMVGNHHDAWVNGAEDPTSGSVALLETARALGNMVKQGWRPKRTIKIALWDSEEFGLIGSTEWVEKHQDELRKNGVAYLNSDMNGRGWLGIEGSHTLEAFATEVGQGVKQPGTNQNAVDASLNHRPMDDDLAPSTAKKKSFAIGPLGAGSDYVAFLDFAGIASMNEEFAGMDKGGIYHSVYDSIYWYNHFSDGGHVYGQALSQFTVTALMRLADSDILPFEFGHFASTVSGYLQEIEHESAAKGGRLDFAALRQELQELKANADSYEAALKTAMSKGSLDSQQVAKLNATLMHTERALTMPEGLPNRPWYKHEIYAPGLLTGYGAKTLPGIREAVDEKQWQVATEQTRIVANCLAAFNSEVKRATQDVQDL